MHEALIQRLATRQNLTVKGSANCEVVINAAGGWRFTLNIPGSVLEWFVDAWAPGADTKTWSAWSDWYAIKGKPTREELIQLYAADVEHFVARIQSAQDFRRITRTALRLFWIIPLREHVLQGRIGDDWQDIKVGVLPPTMNGAAA